MKTNRALEITDYLENEYFTSFDSPCFETVEVDEIFDEEQLPERMLEFGDEVEIPCDDLEEISQEDLEDIYF